MEPTAIEPAPPPFTLLETNESLEPWRSRSVLSNYRRFVGRDGAVLVKPELLGDLRRRALQALPAETGGLVAGRVYRDEHGPYTVVFGFQEAPPGAGGPGRFRMDTDATHQLKRRLSAAEPTCDVIGWWHSHSHPMPYSSIDRANQALWTDPHHVGVLVFAHGSEFGLVYQGPSANLLPFDRQQCAGSNGQRPKPARSLFEDVRPLSAQLAPYPGHRAARRPPPRGALVLPVLMLALLLVVVGLQIVELTRSTPSPVQNTSPTPLVTHSHSSHHRGRTSTAPARRSSTPTPTPTTSPAELSRPAGGHPPASTS